jgi:hypothetical protein
MARAIAKAIFGPKNFSMKTLTTMLAWTPTLLCALCYNPRIMPTLGLKNNILFSSHFNPAVREYTPQKKGSRVSRPQPGCHYQTLPGRE